MAHCAGMDKILVIAIKARLDAIPLLIKLLASLAALLGAAAGIVELYRAV